MKKALSLVLVMILLLSSMPMIAFAYDADDGLAETNTSGTTGDCTWTLSNSVLTISGNGAMDNYSKNEISRIPWYNIRDKIESIEISNGVSRIGSYAFYDCENLQSVSISESVIAIGAYAFLNCAKLKAVFVKNIFAWCQIDFEDGAANPLSYSHYLYLNDELIYDLVLPDGLTTIKSWAFPYCYSLMSISIPDSVTNIGEYAFYNCASLDKVVIGSGVQIINNYAFYCCNRLDCVGIYSDKCIIADNAIFKNDSLVLYGFENSTTKSCAINNGIPFKNIIDLPDESNPYSPDIELDDTASLEFSETKLTVGVRGSYYANIDEALQRINSIRYEACKEGIANPADTNKKLTMEDYHELKWSSALEKTAKIRAAESLLTMHHGRPNGMNCFSVDDDVVYSREEILAYNSSKNMIDGIEQFYEEKNDWVNNTGAQTGHYEALIDPRNYYIGLGGFFSEDYGDYSSCLCGRLSGDFSGIDESKGSSTEEIIVPIEVRTSYLDFARIRKLTDSTNILTIGKQCKLEMIFTDWSEKCHFINLNETQWSSSDNSIASIDENGVVTAFQSGQVTITAETMECITAKATLNIIATDNSLHYGSTGDCTWLLKGNELTISGNGKMADYNSSGDAPWGTAITKVKINQGVTRIGKLSFARCKNLISIRLPASVTSIGDNAFLNSSLCAIKIPDSVTDIGYKALCGTIWDNHQLVGDGLVYIGKVAYEYTGECPERLIIKDGTTGISGGAFVNCKNLKSITIPGSVKTIGKSAFNACYYGTSLQEVILGEGVQRIEDFAFSQCSSLESITLPDSVTYIGHSAFQMCENLKSIKIGKGIKRIGTNAFALCSSLQGVYISDIKTWCNIQFDDAWSNPLLYANHLYLNGDLVTNLIIPDGVTEIRDYAFEYYTSLQSVVLCNTVKSIGNSAFDNCTSLTGVIIPDSVSYIDDNAFCWCDNLTSVSFGNGIKSIGEYSFYACKIDDLTIGSNVKTVGDYAFYRCRLKSVLIPSSVTYIGKNSVFPYGCIYGYKDSVAEKYAKDNNISFYPIIKTVLGDVDGIGGIESVDATLIQRYIAQIPTPYTKAELMRGDVDSSGDLELTDVTAIQYYLCHLKTPYPIGETVS